MTESMIGAAHRLAPSQLQRKCDLSGAGFATTEELLDPDGVLAQARAVEAIRFSVGMRSDGCNLFAMGPDGHGRHTTVRNLLTERAAREPLPRDWCYVFNFETPHKPLRLDLPAGRAPQFSQDLQRLVEELQTGIPAAFETDEYRAHRQEIEAEFNDRQEKGVGAVGEKARRSIAAIAERMPLQWSFQIARGALGTQILSAAAEADLIVEALCGCGRAALQLAEICSDSGRTRLVRAHTRHELDQLRQELRRHA